MIINYASDRSSAEELSRTVIANGDKAHVVRPDVCKVEEIEKLFESVITLYGRLEIFVNNAGVATYKAITDFIEDEFDTIMNLNLKGFFFCCREAARVMADNGCIINIGSTVTRVMLPTYSAYAATKGGGGTDYQGAC